MTRGRSPSSRCASGSSACGARPARAAVMRTWKKSCAPTSSSPPKTQDDAHTTSPHARHSPSRGHGADHGRPARSAGPALARRPDARPAARRAHAPPDPHLHRRRPSDAGHRYRRQYGRLQRRQQRASPAAALPATRTPGRGLAYGAGRIRDVEPDRRSPPLPIDVLHVRRAQSHLRAHRRLVCRVIDGHRHRRAGAGAQPADVRRHAAGARRPADARTLAVARRPGPGGAARRDARPRLLAAPVRRRSRRHRTRHHD